VNITGDAPILLRKRGPLSANVTNLCVFESELGDYGGNGMDENKQSSTEVLEGAQMHSQHESWIAITTGSTFIGIVILVALIVLLIIVVDLHFSRSSLAILAAFIALIVYMFVWRSTPMRRRGILGNVELSTRVNLNLNTELGATNVNVDSHYGVVTLRGFVAHADFREQAEQITRRCGAHQVINELTVAPPEDTPVDSYFAGMPSVATPEGAPEVSFHTPLEQLVREALEDDKRVNSYLLRIKVQDGVAILTGRQDTVQASDAATETALCVPGMLGVNNDVEIESSV